MRLTVLGMNGPYPAAGSACSGYLLTEGDHAVQFDMGCGTLANLMKYTAPEMLDGLLFSHWHHDHCSDVLPLIYRMADRMAAGGEPLPVWGPEDETSPEYRAVQGCAGMSLHAIHPGDCFAVGPWKILVGAARHPVPAVMYRAETDGKSFCYTGDTNTIESLVPFARKADLLVADGLFTDEAWAEGKPHLSASLAAKASLEAETGKLMITHLHPSAPIHPLLQQARAVRPDVILAECGLSVEF